MNEAQKGRHLSIILKELEGEVDGVDGIVRWLVVLAKDLHGFARHWVKGDFLRLLSDNRCVTFPAHSPKTLAQAFKHLGGSLNLESQSHPPPRMGTPCRHYLPLISPKVQLSHGF